MARKQIEKGYNNKIQREEKIKREEKTSRKARAIQSFSDEKLEKLWGIFIHGAFPYESLNSAGTLLYWMAHSGIDRHTAVTISLCLPHRGHLS